MRRSPVRHLSYFFFFFNDTATTEIYTLSLHDALPISERSLRGYSGLSAASKKGVGSRGCDRAEVSLHDGVRKRDRKSTRLNSSHVSISYAVFCLKKKK